MSSTLETADLSGRPLTAAEARRVFRYGLSLFVVALILTPAAAVRLGASDPLYALVLGGAITTLGITAMVLLIRARVRRSSPTTVLGAGFAYAAATLLPYALLSPNLAPGFPGAIGARPTAAPYLWISWQLGLLIALLAYQSLRSAERAAPGARTRAGIAVRGIVLLYAIATPIAIWAPGLPPIATDGTFTPFFDDLIAPLIALLAAASIVATFRTRGRINLLDAWIAIVAFGVLVQIYLTLVGETRFAVGWYAGRILVLVTSASVLAVLLLQAARVYAELIVRAAVLEGEAHTDTLTGLPNRRRFNEEFARAFGSAVRRSSPLGIAVIDIDRFKDYNDAFGHQAGDGALRRIAEAIAESVERSGDFAARYGGEEFVVILEDTTLTGAAGVAERIRHAVLDAHIPAPGGGILSVSVGVAARLPGSSGEELLGQADAALYAAKHRGRNRVESWRSGQGAPIGSAYDEPLDDTSG